MYFIDSMKSKSVVNFLFCFFLDWFKIGASSSAVCMACCERPFPRVYALCVLLLMFKQLHHKWYDNYVQFCVMDMEIFQDSMNRI